MALFSTTENMVLCKLTHLTHFKRLRQKEQQQQNKNKQTKKKTQEERYRTAPTLLRVKVILLHLFNKEILLIV